MYGELRIGLEPFEVFDSMSDNNPLLSWNLYVVCWLSGAVNHHGALRYSIDERISSVMMTGELFRLSMKTCAITIMKFFYQHDGWYE